MIDTPPHTHTQAETLLDVPVPDLSAGEAAMESLKALGCACVVLTMGERGLLFTQCRQGVWSRVEHIEAHRVEAIDTTVSTSL